MKFFSLVIMFSIALFGAESVPVGEKFQTSDQCKACHLKIVNDWKKSWHAKSHYQNDEYFRKTIDYVQRKTRKSLNSIKVQCATCHNPRISVTSTDINYEIDAVMGLDKDSEVNKALKSEVIGEGINCVVCHNIDTIHTDADDSVRGIDRVEWTKTGVMSGPYDDASSPYHKVEHREFMDTQTNQLCFVCHANDKAMDGFVFTNMKSEYKEGARSCVECHMGAKKLGVASTIRDIEGNKKERKVRAHRFEGAHTPSMWVDALKLELRQVDRELIIEIQNPQPHNIPSGFGSRELIVEVVFTSGAKEIATQNISLTNNYISKRKKATIPHLAVRASKDRSIPAQGKRVLKISTVKGSDTVSVNVYYVLVNEEVRSLLQLEEKVWSEKNFIVAKSIKLQN